MPSNAQWIEDHLNYLSGLKKLSQQQQKFIQLATRSDLAPLEEKQFKAALKLEKAAQLMQKAKNEASAVENAAKKMARKERDHELYKCAGLLSLAGLVDKETGLPLMDRSELLGALMGLASVPADDARRQEWKKAGNNKFDEVTSTQKTKTPETA